MNNLKKLRLENGLTQSQVCKELEKINCYIDRTTYAKYENGKRKHFNEIIIKFAILFDTSTDYILGISDDKTPLPKGEKAEEFLNKKIFFK